MGFGIALNFSFLLSQEEAAHEEDATEKDEDLDEDGTSFFASMECKCVFYVMQHAKTRLFSPLDICHKSAFN